MDTYNRLYECADFFMARVALLPVVNEDIQDDHSYEDLLKFACGSKAFLEAIALASPNLYKAIQIWSQTSEENLKKIYASVLKYFLRMTSRATPFGTFSFVGWGTFADKTNLRFQLSLVQKKARLDMEWLNSLVDLLHKDYEFVKMLKVMINPNSMKEGGKITLSRFKADEKKYDVISIKNTIVTEQIFTFAKKPIIYSALQDKLFKIFSEYPQDKIKECLWKIFEQGFFLSELSFRIDQSFSFEEFAKTVNRKLNYTSHDETLATGNFLKELAGYIQAYENNSIGQGISLIETLIEKAGPWKTVEYPLQVDTYLNSDALHLNKKTKDLMEEIATVIYCLTRKVKQFNPIDEYHKQFLEKYGVTRLVPIQELTSSIFGLGFPKKKQEEEFNDKNNWFEDFLSLQQPSVIQEINVEEIVKKNMVNLLDTEQKAPLSVELFLEITADSQEEMDKGHFNVIMNPIVGSIQAGSTFGRFLYLWDQSKKESLCQFLKKEEALQPHVVRIEASFTPVKARTANVCYFEKTRQYQLQFHYQEENDYSLELDDIYVGAYEERLYLYSKKLNKEIQVGLSTAINSDLAPPLLKLMLDISEKHLDNYNPFILQEHHHLTYLPRLRYKNVVLSPARWYFTFEKLGLSKEAKFSEIEVKLQIALQKYNVPDYIFLTEFDNRLKVNWKRLNEFKLIVEKLTSKKEIILFEYIPLQDGKLLESDKGYHVAEIVIPLIKKRNKNQISQTINAFPTTLQIPILERSKFPGGSDWLYIKYFLPIDLEADFITIYLKNFADSLIQNGLIDKWFYLRYIEEKSHIRFRLHGKPDELMTHVLPLLLQWNAQLIERAMLSDFSLHTFEKEIERYGGPAAMDSVEDIFYADSVLCASLIKKVDKKLVPFSLEYMSALAIVNMMKGFCPDIDAMVEFLSPMKTHMNLLIGSRTQLKQLIRFSSFLVNKADQEEMLKLFPYYAHFYEQFQEIDKAIKKFHNEIEKIAAENVLWNSKNYIFDSIIHMHCNRLMGTNHEMERKARVITYALINKQKYSNLNQSIYV